MSEYEYLPRLSDYPVLLDELDTRFGGPEYKGKKRIRGRKELRQILEYLSNNKQSIPMEITRDQQENKSKSKKQIKSRADYFKKFIQKYLIPKRVVVVDGFKKEYNNKADEYSLTPFGILYSIHFLSKDTDTIIDNLAIEYKNELPKVFGKWDLFKKRLGKKYLAIIGLKQIAETGDRTIMFGNSPPGALMDLVRDTSLFWSGDRITDPDRWTKQISLMVYTNILSFFYNRSFNLEYTIGFQKMDRSRILRRFWEKFLEGEEDIRNWYSEFIEKAVVAYTGREKGVSEMRSCLT